MSNLPIILIEVVLVFGGALAFGIWQLRSLERSKKPRDNRSEKER